MVAGYDVALATPDDLSGIIALQDANQPDRGGILSARFPQEWIFSAIVNDTDPSRQPAPTDESSVPIGVRLQPNELPVLAATDLKMFQRRGAQWQTV